MVTSCSGSGGRAGTAAQPASRVNLSRLLLVAAGVTHQYFTGQREGTDQYCQSLTVDVDTHNHGATKKYSSTTTNHLLWPDLTYNF